MAIRPGVIGHAWLRRNRREFIPEDRPIVIDKDLRPEVSFTFVDVIPGQLDPHEFHSFP